MDQKEKCYWRIVFKTGDIIDDNRCVFLERNIDNDYYFIALKDINDKVCYYIAREEIKTIEFCKISETILNIQAEARGNLNIESFNKYKKKGKNR